MGDLVVWVILNLMKHVFKSSLGIQTYHYM